MTIVGHYAHDAVILVDNPDLPLRVVIQQFFIAFGSHIAGPDDLGPVDIGVVVDPLIGASPAATGVHQQEMLSGHVLQLRLNSGALELGRQTLLVLLKIPWIHGGVGGHERRPRDYDDHYRTNHHQSDRAARQVPRTKQAQSVEHYGDDDAGNRRGIVPVRRPGFNQQAGEHEEQSNAEYAVAAAFHDLPHRRYEQQQQWPDEESVINPEFLFRELLDAPRGACPYGIRQFVEAVER